MKQYHKNSVNDCLFRLGYVMRGYYYGKAFGEWERRIWIQNGVGRLSGSFTVNLDIIHCELLEYINNMANIGKGNAVISIRIGDILGVKDKWYSSITPNCIDATTAELIRDLEDAVIKFERLDNAENISRYLWERGNNRMSLYVMALYLPVSRIIEISTTIDLPPEMHERVMSLSKLKSAQQVDSAEASTMAVPPSDPSGSPR